jgi:Abnormal spindle-like microcephaly-assoc'd, ASPM-SPD-2-Hydin/Flagellar-associated PapD-like
MGGHGRRVRLTGVEAMVRRMGVPAALAVMLGSSGCADRDRTTTVDARLVFSGERDFQRVPMHSTREMRVALKNIGRSPIHVLEVWTEDKDGAYLARIGHEGGCDVMAGGECEVVLRFKPRREGPFPAYFVARSDSISEPILRVPLNGIGVDARARISQSRLDFGRIELGSEKLKSLTLENPSDLSIIVTPTGIGADQDEFQFEPVTLAPFEKRTLDVLFRPIRVGQKRAALGVAPCEGCADLSVMLVAEGLDRAIIAEPPELDFGQVPMDRDASQVLTLRNISTEPQAVTGVKLAPATDPSFSFLGGVTPVTLQGGETRDFAFHYAPGHMGLASGEVVFSVESSRNPELKVPMAGWGGAAELCVSPAEHWLSPQPVGAKVWVRVTVRNCGTSNSGPLTVTDLVVRPSASGIGGYDQFNLSDVGLPRTLAAGEEFTFRVYYEPTRVGEHAATVGVRTGSSRVSSSQVHVYGRAEPHLPCQLAITPATVDFGTVLPKHNAVLGVKIRNVGTDVCPVKNIEILDDGGGVFRMPGGTLPGVIIHAGYYFSFMVQFDSPERPDTFSGSLKIEVSDPARPIVYVPLTANSQNSCIVARPAFVDFGITRPDCPFGPRSFNLENICSTPVDVSSVAIGPGTTDGEFELLSAPPPMSFAPGHIRRVEVKYLASILGLNLSPLYVGVEGLSRPLLVPLVGESTEEGDAVDRFVQQDGRKVDVLFVVDNTTSMIEEHPKLAAAIPAFVSEARARNVDLHVAVTTTGFDEAGACPGGAQGGEAGRLFPVDNGRPRVLGLQTPDLVSALQENVQVGRCAFIEQGLEAVRRALSPPLVDSADDLRTPQPNDGNAGFLRPEAALAVLFVSDEDDHSPDGVEVYVNWLRSLKGYNQPQRSAIYAIAPTASSCSTAGGTGTRYDEAARRTGGDVLSVCASDYAPMLQQVAGKAFAPQDRFALSGTPEPGSVQVFVNGVEQSGGWFFDSSKDQVVFSSLPSSGAEIEVHYRRICQH